MAAFSGASPITTSIDLALVEAGIADHADDAVVRRDINHERVGDQRQPGGVAQVVGRIDIGRHIHLDDQRPGVGSLDGNRLHLGAFQQLVAQHRRQLAARRRLGGKRGDLRRGQPLHQPLPPEIGDRGHEHEHFGEHDEENGEQQQFGRQSRHVAGHRRLLRRCAWGLVVQGNQPNLSHRRWRGSRYPRRRKKPMMLRSQLFVKVGK